MVKPSSIPSLLSKIQVMLVKTQLLSNISGSRDGETLLFKFVYIGVWHLFEKLIIIHISKDKVDV